MHFESKVNVERSKPDFYVVITYRKVGRIVRHIRSCLFKHKKKKKKRNETQKEGVGDGDIMHLNGQSRIPPSGQKTRETSPSTKLNDKMPGMPHFIKFRYSVVEWSCQLIHTVYIMNTFLQISLKGW